MRKFSMVFGTGYGQLAALLLCAAVTGCIAPDDDAALPGNDTVHDEMSDTVLDEVLFETEQLRVTISSVDEDGGIVIGVVAAVGATIPAGVVDADTAYDVYLAMGGDSDAMPAFIERTRVEPAELPGSLGVPLSGVTGSVTYSTVDCSLAADGGWFDDLWQEWDSETPGPIFHWYYSGSSTYNSTPTFQSNNVRSHLCNQSVSGAGQVKHRMRGTYGTGYYQKTLEVPEDHRSYVLWLSPAPNYYKYNSYATRMSDWYTASGNYKLGIMGKP